MPLLAAKLKQGLLAITGNGSDYPKTPNESAARWARAYADYAQDAISLAGCSPAPLTANEEALAATLLPVFANPYGTPASTAQIYDAAFSAFWFGPPVAFPLTPAGTPPPPPALPGIVTLVGTGTLAPALISAWAANFAASAPADQAMAQVAAVIDAFTHTVIVTHLISVPGPPIVGPIS
jgi:hypothetical protein